VYVNIQLTRGNIVMTILVTGARGKIGRQVLAGLSAAGRDVRAASRDAAALDLPADVPVVSLDLSDPRAAAKAFDGVDQVFLYAEPTGVEALLTAARAAGVGHVVLLSSGSVGQAAAESDPLALHHLLVERALAASGVEHTVLRPGAFASNAANWAYGIRAAGVVELPYPDSRLAPVHEDDIADVAVAVLTGAAPRSGVLDLTGPESMSFAEQIAVLADVTGRPIEVRVLTEQQTREQLGRHMAAPLVDSLLAWWAAGVGVPAPVADTVEVVTGKPARTFRQWAQENRAAFLPA
jgi:uncharacterized protein YbjT (DUF2867 family)